MQLSEHLLYLQRNQRCVLASTGSLYSRLTALDELLAGFEVQSEAADGHLATQVSIDSYPQHSIGCSCSQS